jgi:NTP pyrophosphatase (non-canonical NTP hydrolase)
MDSLDIAAIIKQQRQFVAERKWEKFHTPKNLSMALAVEASELMEIFQWLSQKEAKQISKDPEKAKAVKDELADVFFYLVRLADILQVDLGEAFTHKMSKNAAKYPVHLARGNARKYNEFLRGKGLNPR